MTRVRGGVFRARAECPSSRQERGDQRKAGFSTVSDSPPSGPSSFVRNDREVRVGKSAELRSARTGEGARPHTNKSRFLAAKATRNDKGKSESFEARQRASHKGGATMEMQVSRLCWMVQLREPSSFVRNDREVRVRNLPERRFSATSDAGRTPDSVSTAAIPSIARRPPSSSLDFADRSAPTWAGRGGRNAG